MRSAAAVGRCGRDGRRQGEGTGDRDRARLSTRVAEGVGGWGTDQELLCECAGECLPGDASGGEALDRRSSSEWSGPLKRFAALLQRALGRGELQGHRVRDRLRRASESLRAVLYDKGGRN